LFRPVFLSLFAHESRRLLAFRFIPLAGYRSGLRSPFPARPIRCSTFRLGVPHEPCRQQDLLCPLTSATLVKVNRFTLSYESVTRHRSPEVSSTAFDAQPPDLQPVSLMDMGFAVACPLACHRGPPIGSCSSARIFAPRFFQAPPRGECYFTLALRYHFTSITL
jgi:hypothetical protein